MKELTEYMIQVYQIRQLGYDMMGYNVHDVNKLTYHHLIVPRRHGGKMTFENGAVLTRLSHDYLHLIERLDYEIFLAVTSELIDETVKREIALENLKEIRKLLVLFEKEYSNNVTKKGKPAIKPEYITDRIKIKGLK